MKPYRDARIEISGFCNASCPYCPASDKANKSKLFMEPLFFEEIITHLLDVGVFEKGDVVGLFCRGEPFIHPNLSDILQLLKRHSMKACISSNFMKPPTLNADDFEVLNDVTISINSFKQERYKKIYGGDVQKTLKNLDAFLEQKERYNPKIEMYANWIKYKFNGDELDSAREQFAKRGVKIQEINGSIIDFNATIDIIERKKTDAEIERIDGDIHLKEQLQLVESFTKHGVKRYFCDVTHDVIVDELGRWVRCSYISSNSADFVIGSYKDITPRSIKMRELLCDTCQKCLKYAVSDTQYAPQTIMLLEKISPALERLANSMEGKRVAIYGFGLVGEFVFSKLKKHTKFIIDDKKCGNIVDGTPIIGFEELDENEVDTVVLAFANSSNTQNLKTKLLSARNPLEIVDFEGAKWC